MIRNLLFLAWLIGAVFFYCLPSRGEEETPAGKLYPTDIPRLINPAPAPEPEPAVTTPAVPEKKAARIKLLIDPGHGGYDWGAIGVCEILEKDLVLEVSQILFEQLKGDPRFEVTITRDTDVFPPLEERKRIARELAVDFFVSIHANSGRRVAADGPEVFFLSLKASDKAAMQVAVRENLGNEIEEATFDQHPGLEMILQDMAQTDHLKKSSVLAELIFDELIFSLPGESRGVKQAPFVVLNGIGIPAVLVEIGFITNPDDCYLLSTDYGKEIAALAISEGIRKFGQILIEERNQGKR